MSHTFTRTLATRRDADLLIERLVQELGIERTDIFIAAEGAENSAGVIPDGSDNPGVEAGEPERDDGAHAGGVTVSVDINDDDLADRVDGAFAEFEASQVPD